MSEKQTIEFKSIRKIRTDDRFGEKDMLIDI